MVDKQVVYFLDSGLSETGGSVISGYTKLNSGDQFFFNCGTVALTMSKPGDSSPSLGKVDASGYYQESKVKHNCVNNRLFTISGVIDMNNATDVVKLKTMLLMERSPAIFYFKSVYTADVVLNSTTYVVNDDPNSATTVSGQSEFTAGNYVKVIPRDFSSSTSASDTNIIEFNFTLELTL